MKVFTIAAFFAASVKGFDIWDVLQADLTCCVQHNDNQDKCLGESGSACRFITKDSGDFLNALAEQDGSNCLGEAYVNCKMEAQDIGACCAPGCTGLRPPALEGKPGDEYNQGALPVCGQKVPTEEPTPFPISPPCSMGNGYDFKGGECQISGDPHTTLFSRSAKHDFQGQPLSKNAAGNYQNSFYYVARCNGYDQFDMPVQILGTHYHWGTRVVSGVDYLTLELTTVTNSVIFLYLSSGVGAYAMNGPGVTKDYDRTMMYKPEALTQLPDAGRVEIGQRFALEITRDAPKSFAKFNLYINAVEGLQDFDAAIQIVMVGQMDVVNGRKRMHYIGITQDQMYKCATCGLCGNFRDSGYTIEQCDGTMADFRAGWNAEQTPEAYDVFGWTYEYHYYNNNCGGTYDIHDNTDGLPWVDPCNPEVAPLAEAECKKALSGKVEECCDMMGGCEQQLQDCITDACVIATDFQASATFTTPVVNAVRQIFTDPITEACNVPGFAEANAPWNNYGGTFMGCYIDQSNRAMNIVDWDVPNHDTEKCLYLCDKAGYSIAGMQYSDECFCSNDWEHSTKYGQEFDASKCLRHLEDDPRFANGLAYGCWGGGWRQCLYEIIPPQTAKVAASRYSKFGRLSEADRQKVDRIQAVQVSVGNGLEHHYLEMAMAGFVVMSLVGGMVVYSRRNKDEKYLPIQDSNQV